MLRLFIRDSHLLTWISLGSAISAIIATFIFGGHPFLGFSPRAYVLAPGAGFGCWWLWQHAEQKVRHRVIKLLAVYGIFVAWLAIVYLWHGFAPGEVLKKMASTHILAVLTFFAILPAASLSRSRDILVVVLVGTILTSGALAMLQWLRIDWAWDLAQTLNTRFVPLWGGSAPGFSMNSVSLSYQFLLVAPFVLAFVLSPRSSAIPRPLIFLLSLAIPTLAVVVQSRSLLAGLWIITLFLGWRMWSHRSLGAPVLTFVFGLGVATALLTPSGIVLLQSTIQPTWVHPSISTGEYGGWVFTASDKIRLSAAEKVWYSIELPSEYLAGPGCRPRVIEVYGLDDG